MIFLRKVKSDRLLFLEDFDPPDNGLSQPPGSFAKKNKMEKIDLQKKFRAYYSATSKPALVILKQAKYLAITGQGDPSAAAFTDKIQTLYKVSYAIKFLCKARNQDFTVAKLEGQWWFDELKYKNISMTDAPKSIPRNEWKYRLLIQVPDFVSFEDLSAAKTKLSNKGQTIGLSGVILYEIEGGPVVQALHIGPFDTEPETLMRIQEYILENKLERSGFHHEVYLSDFRKTAPEKLRTIFFH